MARFSVHVPPELHHAFAGRRHGIPLVVDVEALRAA
jgi:hypothetical protein